MRQINTEINEDQIENYYQEDLRGHRFLKSFDLYMPVFKVGLDVDIITKVDLDVFEEFICRLLLEGVNREEDIMKVLGLDRQTFDVVIEDLLNQNYLVDIDSYLKFSQLGEEFVKKRIKNKKVGTRVKMYYDGVLDRFIYDNQEERHRFLSLDALEREEGLVLPRFSPKLKTNDKSLMDRIKFEIVFDKVFDEKLRPEDLDIKDVRLLRELELFFHRYKISVYMNSNSRPKFLVHDYCGMDYSNSDISRFVEVLYEEDSLDNFLKLEDSDLGKVSRSKGEKLNQTELDINIKEEPEVKLEYLKNKEIKKRFNYYVDNAQTSLYITSPWINGGVVDKNLMDRFERLLKKNVEIKIIYGMPNKNKSDADTQTEKMAKKLKKRYKSYGDLFKMKHGDTHEKIVICDKKYMMLGSFNLLSFNGKGIRKESMLCVNDPESLGKALISFNF